MHTYTWHQTTLGDDRCESLALQSILGTQAKREISTN